MEGLNLGAFFIGYLAIFAFGITSLVAVVLWIARRGAAARILFASGFLGAAVMLALAMLSFFAPEFRHSASVPLILFPSASLLMAGAGQFIAALRDSRVYAAAFGCAAVALALLASPLLGGDWAGRFFSDLSGLHLAELDVPLLVAASLIPAAASVGIATLLPSAQRVAPTSSTRV